MNKMILPLLSLLGQDVSAQNEILEMTPMSEAAWSTENLILGRSQFGYDTDNLHWVQGNGVNEYKDLTNHFRFKPATTTVAGFMSPADKVKLDGLAAPVSLSFTNNASRTIQTVAAAGNGWQLSSTRNADVSYSVTIGTTVSLSGNSGGYVVLEVAATNSSTAANWQEVARVSSGQSGTLVIGLVLNQTGGGCLTATVPAGYYVRLRSVNTAGTPSYTYNSGQEVLK